jgi:hypothetical protein
MENVTVKKRELAPAFMARVDACAYIFMADRPEKIAAIAESRGVSDLEAGRIYTIGALKAAKRRGTARTYREALERLEAEQVGDRGCIITRTVSADKTARVLAYYQHKNAIAPTYTAHIDYVRMAWARMDNQPISAYTDTIPAYVWRIEDNQPQEEKRPHTVNVGKVLGTLYTDIEHRQVQADSAYRYDKTPEIIQNNMRRYFTEYKSRLSKTVKAGLAELAEYVNTAEDGTDKAIRSLTSAKGRASPATSKMAKFAANLHWNFEHKDCMTCPEFISLLCQYGEED